MFIWCFHHFFPTSRLLSSPILANPRASQVDPKLQIEYASSWLEGRFMGLDLTAVRLMGVARYLAAKGMLGVFHAGTKAGSASAWNWMNQNRSKIAANPENCSTAPKIHMEPENGPLQFEIPCWKSSFSGFMLKFQECT